MSKRHRAATAAAAGAAAVGRPRSARQDMVLAIILSIVEAGRVPVIRFNSEGGAIETATARPRSVITLPWTGAGNLMSLPQGQTVIFITRDPTCPLMYYDYNNGGGGGAAEGATYLWIAYNDKSGPVNTFTVGEATTTPLTPMGAFYSSGKAFHTNWLFAKVYGDRYYVHCDAPPTNDQSSISALTIAMSGAGKQASDVLVVTIYRLAEGADVNVFNAVFSSTGVGPETAAIFAVPLTDKYRIVCRYEPAPGNPSVSITVQVQQSWACGTLCHVPIPQLQTIWMQLNRLRMIGVAIDVVNQTPEQFRGGSVIATQLSAGTSEYQALQGSVDPYAYMSNLRGVEPADFKMGRYTFIKPDGDGSLEWKRPFRFDSNGVVGAIRMPALQADGFVMLAVSAPDLVSGASTTTTRGQVTLDVRMSIEIDTQFTWMETLFSRATAEEWDIAEAALSTVSQNWDDPNWGKIWNAIKSGLRIGGQIASVIPHPVTQRIGRGVTTVADTLDAL